MTKLYPHLKLCHLTGIFPFPEALPSSPSLLALPPLCSRPLRPALTPQLSSPWLSFPSPSSAPQSPELLASSVSPKTGPLSLSCLLSGLWVWFAPTSTGCPEAVRKHRQSPVCLWTPGRYRWHKHIRSFFGLQRQVLAAGADEDSSRETPVCSRVSPMPLPPLGEGGQGARTPLQTRTQSEMRQIPSSSNVPPVNGIRLCHALVPLA